MREMNTEYPIYTTLYSNDILQESNVVCWHSWPSAPCMNVHGHLTNNLQSTANTHIHTLAYKLCHNTEWSKRLHP